MLRYAMAILAIIAFAGLDTVRAADKEGRFIVVGVGNVSCGRWAKERRADSMSSRVFDGWVQGYFTSFNQWADRNDTNILKGTDIDGVEASMDNYCASHPMQPIAAAAENALGEIINAENKKIIDGITAAAEKESRQKNPH